MKRCLPLFAIAILGAGLFGDRAWTQEREKHVVELSQQMIMGTAPIQRLEQITGDPEYLMIPMRDGTKLWTVVWKPKGKTGRLPTILVRTPYTTVHAINRVIFQRGALAAQLASSGYVIVVQNERGSFLSQGKFRIMGGAGEDGYDTIDWISKQPWSNGRVGTIGCSSAGDNQIPLAATHHPAHVAMVPEAAGSGVGRMGPFQEQGLVFRGGALQIGPWVPWYRAVSGLNYQLKLPPDADAASLAYYGKNYPDKPEVQQPTLDYMTMMRTLPIQDATHAAGGGPTDYDYLWRMHPNDPRFKLEPLVNEGEDDIQVPGLWLAQAHDVGVQSMFAAFEYAHEKSSDPAIRANQFVIVSPMDHCKHGLETEYTIIGERNIGDARLSYEKIINDWFDYWVKDGAKPTTAGYARPRAEIYVPGRNQYQSYKDWPPPTNQTSYYFSSSGSANSRMGDGKLVVALSEAPADDRFVYDPMYPVPTTGGDSCCSPIPGGSVDQSAVELRHDVLVYTSDPLKTPIDVVGWAEVDVFLSSSVPDTDLTAKLIDVDETGRAYNVGESIQRVRWRDGYKKPVFMKAGEVYRVRVGPFFTSNHFLAGHRIRIDVSSSNFPRYDRNLNTGGNNYDESEGRIAQNVVHHSKKFPSRVLLPVVNPQ